MGGWIAEEGRRKENQVKEDGREPYLPSMKDRKVNYSGGERGKVIR